MARLILAVIPGVVGAAVMLPAPARADLCPYPGVGVGANVLVAHGGFCDFPTEINGAHMHCETGGFGLGGVFGGGFGMGGGAVNTVIGSSGVGGASCSWRCPDNTLAPQPNPPGAWNKYLVVMDSTNFCALEGHMDPNGFWSAPVLPTEGIPPEGEPPPVGSPHLDGGEPGPAP